MWRLNRSLAPLQQNQVRSTPDSIPPCQKILPCSDTAFAQSPHALPIMDLHADTGRVRLRKCIEQMFLTFVK
jgi:hypothetical protein